MVCIDTKRPLSRLVIDKTAHEGKNDKNGSDRY